MIKNFIIGAINAIISFPAMLVVTSVLGLNLANAFFFAGIGTIIFHIITKNKLPIVLGVSGSFIAVMISIANSLGSEYIGGAVIAAGCTYIVLGALSLKWQDKILNLFPNWLLAMAIVLIGLSLLPIGQSMITNSTVALITLVAAMLANLSSNKYISTLAMLVGIVTGFISTILMGIPLVPAAVGVSLDFNLNIAFNFGACLQMVLLTIVVFSEMLGDTKNTGDIIGKDVFKEVGLGRIAIANGISSIVSGSFGNNAYTTYSENIGALMILKHFNPTAQLFTAIIFIVASFFTELFVAVSYIPMSVFGGVLLFLYGIVTLNAIKQIDLDLKLHYREMIIMGAMLAVSYIPINLFGITVSGTAAGLVTGIILNKITEKKSI